MSNLTLKGKASEQAPASVDSGASLPSANSDASSGTCNANLNGAD